MDQLPGQRGVLRDHLEHRRWVLLLPGRPAPTADALPVQQRTDRHRRPLPLPPRPGERRATGPRRGSRCERISRTTGAGTAWGTRSSARGAAGSRAETLYFVPLGETLEIWRTRITNHRDGGRGALAVQRRSSSASGTRGTTRRTSSGTLDRRGRGGGRGHLSHDRVPGAPEPFRLLRLFGGRSPASTRSARASSVPTAAGTDRRPSSTVGRETRSRTDGRRSGRITSSWSSSPGETREVVFVLGYGENPPDAKFDPPGSQTHRQATGGSGDRAVPASRGGRCRASPARGALGGDSSSAFQVSTPSEHTDRMVNVWNAYQCMVTFNLSRSASFFDTGIGRGIGFRDSSQDLLGFVHMAPGARARADPGPRRDAASDRRRLPPVPAAHEARERRDRLRLQRRPALADPRGRGLRQGDRRPRDPRRAGPLRQRTGIGDAALRAPPPGARLHPGSARPARAAADRPGGLERLPQPQRLLGGAGRVLPDGSPARGRRGRVGVHRRPVRARGGGARAARGAARRSGGRSGAIGRSARG